MAKANKSRGSAAPPVQPISARFPALEEEEVTLTFSAPNAVSVQLAGTFNDWRPEATSLARMSTNPDSGDWIVRLTLKAGIYEYRFVVDGIWTDDPRATESVANPFGGRNAVLRVNLDDRTEFL